MIWVTLLLLVAGFLLFKLGVVTLWVGFLEVLAKALSIVTGAFLLVGAWRWIARRKGRQMDH